MSSDAVKITLVLDGVVRYSIETTDVGETVLKAKWVSSRILGTEQTGTGHAIRRKSSSKGPLTESGFVGAWTIEYFGPDGELAVTPFLLDIEKTSDVCPLHLWPLPMNGSESENLLRVCFPDLSWQMGRA